jgi:putative transport protein
MLTFLWDVLHTHSIANAVVVLSLTAALGLALGSLKVRGISLGIAGVLFSGITLGHIGLSIDPHLLHFVSY